jgi:hypothetical protein
MKAWIAISTLLAATLASAQFVAGNDAVRATAAGLRVDQPPAPAKPPPMCRADTGCHAGAWRMVETSAGLMECTEPWARDGACRASTYGQQKLRRVWVVRRGGEWLQCQYPDLGSRCAPMRARPPANLPADALQ